MGMGETDGGRESEGDGELDGGGVDERISSRDEFDGKPKGSSNGRGETNGTGESSEKIIGCSVDGDRSGSEGEGQRGIKPFVFGSTTRPHPTCIDPLHCK